MENGFGEQGRAIRYVDSLGIPRTKRTGYEGLKLHELRHTQATLPISNGADIKTVQNRLETAPRRSPWTSTPTPSSRTTARRPTRSASCWAASEPGPIACNYHI